MLYDLGTVEIFLAHSPPILPLMNNFLTIEKHATENDTGG
jgi:hypothetical protein